MRLAASVIVLLLLASLSSCSRVCRTIHISHGGFRAHRNVGRLHAQLTEHVAGCQFVFGDLVIQNFGADAVSEAPLDDAIRSLRTDFLDSIVEISGRLVIMRVNLERITLRSLRTIRGHNLEKKSDFYTVDVLQSMYSTRLELPKLSAILSGNVRIIGHVHASLYCPLTRSIDWSNLFQSSQRGSQQQLVDNTAAVVIGNRRVDARDVSKVVEACSSLRACHASCPAQTFGKALCWSDGPHGCQNFHGCLHQPCRSCYNHPGTGSEQCCDNVCVGGCSGRAEACSDCPGVSINGVCRLNCSASESGELGMKQMGNICVQKCEMPLLVSSDSNFCLNKCPPNEIPVSGACERCSVGSCKSCAVDYFVLSDQTATELKNNDCVIWDATSSLDINAQVLTNKASLEALEQLQVFYGRLYIKRTHRLGIDNLRFLRKLRFVSDTLAILLLETRYIGLSSLQYAYQLLLRNISGLCRAWYPSRRIREIQEVTKEFPISVGNLRFDDTSEICRNAACDPQCPDECWGPGPDMCVTVQSNSRCAPADAV